MLVNKLCSLHSGLLNKRSVTALLVFVSGLAGELGAFTSLSFIAPYCMFVLHHAVLIQTSQREEKNGALLLLEESLH